MQAQEPADPFGAAPAVGHDAGNALPPATPTTRLLPVTFDGDARSYFGVWIMNVLLTIVTLGVYSAWAKVRTNRWFYGHTAIDGHNFEYHATGMQIFKGRAIAVAIIVAFSIVGAFAPMLQLLFMLAILFVMPWAINAGLRFTARMTSWRNVRFDFQGNYWRALLLFMLMPIAVMLTLGALAPVASRLVARYVAGGHSYGGAAFRSEPRLRALYAALGRTLLVVIALLIALFVLFALLGMLFGAGFSGFHGLILGFYGAMLVGGAYYVGSVRNEVFNTMTIDGGHRTHSSLAPLRYTWIVVSGLLATAFTLGLAYPWAAVRRHRYTAQNTQLEAAPGLDDFVSTQQRAPSSFGGEFSELEGFGDVAAF